ncbi:RIP metalloprotease RseP [Vogesella sp. LIG4]|uniref:RIP metalloprotease RseP n=1 Tax=Vogesella sp. LIG4 TaxID=1192162 RepID=UPI00081F991C|nr:RIP metalloprotease RseP [Vogesella sp. LIG4]SCK23951.1 regulator of sigma E protease [Vogesella sp. LIG4]
MTLLAFLLVIGVLVTFHEFGHFLAARACGIKVLTFSIGFGRKLISWQPGETEWRIALVPLGGFVRMLDSREGEVPAADAARAFDARPIWQRMIVVSAGPLANLLLAVLLFSWTMSGAQTTIRPLIGTVVAQTAAAAAGVQAGDRVLAVNGQPVADWTELRGTIADVIADGGKLQLRVQRAQLQQNLNFDLERFELQTLNEHTFAKLGLMPVRYLPQVGAVLPGGAGARAGLLTGDRLLAIDGRPVGNWEAWVAWVQNHPGRQVKLQVQRAGKLLLLNLRPDAVEQDGQQVGRIGVAPALDQAWMRQLLQGKQVPAGDAVVAALHRTVELSGSTLHMMFAMLTGTVSLDALSGPLTIAEYAGKSADAGLDALLEFMALISVSLGVFNLLPIPVLDGGHLLYHVIELIRGRPLPERAYEVGQRLGMAFIMTVMLLALFNDFARLLGQ